jgi:hypothetical protein
MRSPVAADIRAIFNAPDQHEAERLLEMFVKRCQRTKLFDPLRGQYS